MTKKLIINADDYGISTEVNDAIENLVRTGDLTDVSVLANGWSYEPAAAFLRSQPLVSIGVHLNVVEGIALSPSNKIEALMGEHGQFVDLRQIFWRWLMSPLAVVRAVEIEWRAQIELMLRDGLVITHADSHQHVHAFPPFWRILTRLCVEYGIPALRFPRERNTIALRRAAALALGRSAAFADRISQRRSLTTSDHFLGFKRTGIFGEDEMAGDLKELKDGVTEMIVHPSLYDGVPYPEMNGEIEFRALQSDGLRQAISSQGVELITWRDVVPA